jgi:glycosyltransferase involved in cell wall biosynthesis
MRALIEAGVDLIIEDQKHDSATVPTDEFWKVEYPSRTRRKERTNIKIWHCTPELYVPNPAHKNVAMCAWETSHIPNTNMGGNPRNNWANQLNRMDTVWTFSTAAKQAMRDSGVTVPIDVIPHPIDLDTYCPTDDDHPRVEIYDAARRPLHDGWFKFLSIFQWQSRKDPLTLLLAYFAEFRGDEQVALVLKTFGHKTGETEEIAKRIAEFRRGASLPHEPPRVFLVPGVLSDPEMIDLVRACDCSVTTSKGEGFCLPIAESLACGVPAITPRGSAFLDYVTEQVGYLVNVHEEPAHGIFHSTAYYITQTWHKTDVQHLRKRMREAFEDKKGLAKRAKAAPKAAKDFDPKKIGKQMKKLLEKLSQG